MSTGKCTAAPKQNNGRSNFKICKLRVEDNASIYYLFDTQVKFPQSLPLYMALFCSLAAIIFSIQIHLSTQFVTLRTPLKIGPFFKNVTSIGLSSWDLCVIKKDVMEDILSFGIRNITSSSETLSNGDLSPVDEISTLFTSSDLNHLHKNQSMILQENAHSDTKTINERSATWTDKLHDDAFLASADFPYTDDDTALSGLMMVNWSCRRVYFSSRDVKDKMWMIPRVFCMIGTIMGMTSTCCLAVLIVFPTNNGKNHSKNSKKKSKRQSTERSQVEHQQIKNIGKRDPFSFATIYSFSEGLTSIIVLLLTSYLFQSVTFLFLDSDICRNHECILSSGAYSLIAACLLWVISGLLVLLMLNKIQKRRIQLKKMQRLMNKPASAQCIIQVDNFSIIAPESERIVATGSISVDAGQSHGHFITSESESSTGESDLDITVLERSRKSIDRYRKDSELKSEGTAVSDVKMQIISKEDFTSVV